jgi:hypothetical protein
MMDKSSINKAFGEVVIETTGSHLRAGIAFLYKKREI